MSGYELNNICGTLIITPIDAEILEETLSANSAPKLFCKIGLGFGAEASELASREGKTFKWRQQFRFRRSSEEQINIELYHKNFFIDPSLLGEGKIHLGRPPVRQEVKTACTLKLSDNEIGKVNLEIRWEPDQVNQGFLQYLNSQVNNSSSASVDMNTDGMQLIIESTSLSSQKRDDFKSEEAKNSFMPNEEAIEQRVIRILNDEGQCSVCYETKKLVVFYKCGHICCCENCAKGIVKNRCPICRQRVLDYIKVYLV